MKTFNLLLVFCCFLIVFGPAGAVSASSPDDLCPGPHFCDPERDEGPAENEDEFPTNDDERENPDELEDDF